MDKLTSHLVRGRGDRNRTHITGFGDRYTNRCTTPLAVLLYHVIDSIGFCFVCYST